ncbi:MAG: hypothetical protein MZV64_43250 [Ignavibacteriales bacterium]|nr:hypothetical protein [Ignavibacteriales bacterium]
MASLARRAVHRRRACDRAMATGLLRARPPTAPGARASWQATERSLPAGPAALGRPAHGRGLLGGVRGGGG